MNKKADTAKFVEFKLQEIFYDKRDCMLLQFRDMSEIHNNIKLESDNKMLQLMSSSVSHEMLTPIKCII